MKLKRLNQPERGQQNGFMAKIWNFDPLAYHSFIWS